MQSRHSPLRIQPSQALVTSPPAKPSSSGDEMPEDILPEIVKPGDAPVIATLAL